MPPKTHILRPITHRRPSSFALSHHRQFLTTTSPPQHLAASRTLPYASEPLYELIADVDSYQGFVPYCTHSRVTSWSEPDARGRRWPALADLHVGWGRFEEVFTSRLRCLPGVSVEAVSDGTSSAVFKSLVTRWSFKPLSSDPTPKTQVHFTVDYEFLSPIYAAVSAAVSDRVADVMIEAFEKRAQEKLASTGHVNSDP
ncbi:hypothetical protein CP533_3296 [Ophiocordyceps camponoti-saundersi (nom. inval.)]|nr:hypothetical protein CP533_3296 [Ophiocordyceps camponoti-saundersi (nom. inval.)]